MTNSVAMRSVSLFDTSRPPIQGRGHRHLAASGLSVWESHNGIPARWPNPARGLLRFLAAAAAPRS
jgi:hypothetical protein